MNRLPAPFAAALGIFVPIQAQFVAEQRLKGEAPALLLLFQVVLHLLALFGAAQGLYAQTDLAIGKIDADDSRLYFVADLVKTRWFVDSFGAQLRYVDQSLDAFFDAYEQAEVGHAGDLALDLGAHRMAIGDDFPRIVGQLLDAERKALVLHIHAEYPGFDHVALLEQLGWMLDFLSPVQVRDMNQTIDALFDTDEDAEIGDIAHWALDHGADRIFLLGRFPGVRHDLLEAERNATMTRIDV